MFTPDLDLKVATRCTMFQVQDKTGVDTGDGTKWDGVAGLDSSTLTAANIRIVSPSGTYTDNDVLTDITSPVTDEFWFSDLTGTQVDGLHNLIYTLKTTNIAITAYADYGTTVTGTVLVTSAGHPLVTGMYVNILDGTNYIGEYLVTKIDANTFYITATWVADDGATTGTITYKSTFYPYVYCAIEAGIEKMYANLSRMVIGETRDKYLNDANTADGLFKALKNAASSSNTDALDAILATLNQILDFNDVDPNL